MFLFLFAVKRIRAIDGSFSPLFSDCFCVFLASCCGVLCFRFYICNTYIIMYEKRNYVHRCDFAACSC